MEIYNDGSVKFNGCIFSNSDIHPVLVETMVFPSRYGGTCYKTAHWIKTGRSSSRGRMGRRNERLGHSPKMVYVYPLCHDFKDILLG